MIVDDEGIVLSFAADALSTVGHEISATSDQQEALRLIAGEKFDFLLTDIKMPEMDGITLARKAQEADPDLSVIFMTGYADVETAKEAIATGAYDYIMKPFELREIRESVESAVKRRIELHDQSGNKGLSKLSDLMGEIYKLGDRQSLLKLILSFALFHFDINAGSIILLDSKRKNLTIASTDNIRSCNLLELEITTSEKPPAEFLETGELHNIHGSSNHPLLSYLLQNQRDSQLCEMFEKESRNLTSFAIKANEDLTVVLILKSERELETREADRNLLTVMLSLSSVSLENLSLLEESRSALAKLESLQDELIGLERIATQGLMSAEIAHELNNFLTIVNSNFELLEMKAGETFAEVGGKYLTTIKKHLMKIEKFTTSLSDAGKMESHKSECDLNEMIEEIASFTTHQRRFRKIKLSINLDPRLPILSLDISQMQQLLYNMLNNAADSIGADRSDGTIEIATEMLVGNNLFTMRIKDNGAGFSQESLQRAFRDRFTTKQAGHGFGLMACKRVIENHGGSVEVNSKKGEGAEIIISLRAAEKISPESSDTKLAVDPA